MTGTSFIIQLVAAVSIPIALVAVVFARTSVQKPIRQRDLAMAIQFAIIPALLVLALQGILPWWATAGGLLLVSGFAFAQGMRPD